MVILAIVALKLFSMLFSAVAKILLIGLIIFVVYAVFAHASRDLVFEGYIFSGQSITVDDKPFIISFNEGPRHPANIQLNYYGSYFFVPEGSCKTIVNIEFCFGNSIFDTDFDKFKANISAYKVVPEITISRAIDKSTLVIGEEAEISVNVTNGIGIPARNFELVDSFAADEFELGIVGGDCSKEGNNAVYRGILSENKGISCHYDIKALKEVERSAKAKVSYFDGVETKYVFSSPIDFDVSQAFAINTYFNESGKKVFEGEDVIFFINMTNNRDDENIEDIVLNIYLPSGLKYDSSIMLLRFYNGTGNATIQSQKVSRINDQLLQFRGELEKNQSKLIMLRLNAVKGGISDIFIDAEYLLDEGKFFTEKKDSLEVEHKEITLFTSFNDLDSFDAGEQKLIKIGVSNPSEKIALKNINVTISTNISDIKGGFLDVLNKTSVAYITNQNIEMPYVDRDTSYPFDVIVNYDTEYGEHHEKVFEHDLSVDAIAGLSVSHEVSNSNLQSGEQFTIKTKVKNERNVDIKNVRIFDVVPMEFRREGLNSVSNININGNDEIVAYEYKMTAPEVERATTYSIRTTAMYNENNKTYAFEATNQITVNPRQMDLSIASAISAPNIYRGAILDVLYTVINPDDEKMLKNIHLAFPMQQDFDLIGQKNYTIDKLLPGESFTIRDIHRIRPKINGSLTLDATAFSYEDEDGNVFFKNSSPITFDADYGYISGPAFIIERSSNGTVFTGDYLESKIITTNVGSEKGDIEIIERGNVWKLTIEPRETDTISYKTKAEKEGILEFKPAYGNYYYQGRDYFTISNSSYTNVTQKTETAEKAPEQEIKEVKIEKVREETVARKTFLGIIWDSLKTIFDVFRAKR
jgi:hypothetical protein